MSSEDRDFLFSSLEDLEREYAAGDMDDADYEALKSSYALYFVFTTGDWFGLNAQFPGAVYAFVGYLVISTLSSLLFSLQKPNASSSPSSQLAE